MISRLRSLHTFFFRVFILFLPTQLAYHFWPSFSFVYGIRVDYLSLSISFLDLLFFIFFGTWILNRGVLALIFKRLSKLWPLLIFLGVNIFFSKIPALALYRWGRVLQLTLIFFYVSMNRGVFEKIKTPLTFGLLFSLFISLSQISKGGSIGGLLYLVGERSFNINTPGISLFNFFGRQILRPYATFPHPNVLAGYSLVCLFLFIINQRKVDYLGALVSVALILLSFSQNAWLAFVLAPIFVFFILKSKNGTIKFLSIAAVSSFFLTIVKASSNLPQEIFQRVELNNISGEIISRHPFFGLGLGNFIPEIPVVANQTVWWLQPVHNIFLLITSETGIVGLLIFIYILYKNVNKINLLPVVSIILTGMWDHYFITLPQTAILFAIVLALGNEKRFDKMSA